MKHVKTLNEKTLKESLKRGGCGECQTSCQSACKTSCTVGNQGCENPDRQSKGVTLIGVSQGVGVPYSQVDCRGFFFSK